MKNEKVGYITGNTSLNKKHGSCNIALKKSTKRTGSNEKYETCETQKCRSKGSDTYHNVVVPNWNDGIEEFGID